MQKIYRSTFALAVLLACWPAAALTVGATQTGLSIDAGTMGRFELGWPRLEGAKALKPIEVRASGATASLRYEGDIRLQVSIKAPGTVTMTFAAKPAGVNKLRMDGLLDYGFAGGGTWRVGGGDEKPFPKDKPDKPFLFQGNATVLSVCNAAGQRLTFTTPPWSWLQLQDNREWGWKIFGWFFVAPLTDALSYELRISDASETGSGPKVVVDRFGQPAQSEFAGKVKSADELKADIAAEAAWNGSLQAPARDAYGGLPGSGARLGLRKTGFFHVEQVKGRWVLVDPEGNAFFHLGLCGFQPSDDYTYVKGRENVYEWLPPFNSEYQSAYRGNDPTAFSYYVANVVRKYGQPYRAEEWAARQIPRVRRWGFTSAGAFSGVPEAAREAARFPYVGHLPLDQWDGGIPRLPGVHEAWDPFDETVRARVERNFAAKVAPRAKDPLLLGWYLVNEPLYEDLPRVVPTLPGKHACKRRLVTMLRDKYQTIERYNAAWSAKAASFEALNDAGLAVATPAAAEDVQAFCALFFETYFQLVAETARRHDPNHLLLGNRLQAGTINNEQLCRIAGKWVDVMSFNYYTYYQDPDFLKRIYAWTGGRPILLSEFHYSSPSDSGLPGGAKDVASQRERGLAYRHYVEQAASLGFVVGVEWFTLIDQALTGRWFSKYNGENGNTGLLSVADRPWRVALESMMAANWGVYDVLLGQKPPFVYDNPRFTRSGVGRRVVKVGRATGPIKLDGSAAGWPGLPAEPIASSRLATGATAGGLEGTFKLCWDDTNLYVLAHVVDATPLRNNHQRDMIWSADALELFIGWEKVESGGGLLFSDRQILLSAGSVDGQHPWHIANQPAGAQPKAPLASKAVADVDGKGYTLVAALPFATLGFQPREGQTIRFDLAIDDSTDGRSRARQLMWNGTERNSTDRTGWGSAVFGP